MTVEFPSSTVFKLVEEWNAVNLYSHPRVTILHLVVVDKQFKAINEND